MPCLWSPEMWLLLSNKKQRVVYGVELVVGEGKTPARIVLY
jgi:hypothetical protein